MKDIGYPIQSETEKHGTITHTKEGLQYRGEENQADLMYKLRFTESDNDKPTQPQYNHSEEVLKAFALLEKEGYNIWSLAPQFMENSIRPYLEN